MSRKSITVLWLLFAVLMLDRLTGIADPLIVLLIMAGVTGIVIVRKCGMPSKKYRILSAVFSAIVSAAYLGYQRNPFILIYGLFAAGIPTLLTSFAVFSVMETRGGYELIPEQDRKAGLRSLGIAVLAGAVLSVINIFISGEEVQFQFSLWKLLLSLNPAIFEEMACRAVFMAYCVCFSQDGKLSRTELFTMYFMMAVPHTVSHGYGLWDTLELCVLFGLPFSVLQRKCCIAAAMISHGLVDAVRFTLIGF